MKDKRTDKEKIIESFRDGQVIAVGGQAGHGRPERLIDLLIESGVKHLTTLSLDTGEPDGGVGKLVHHGMVDKMIAAYAGRNQEAVNLYNQGKLEFELMPMGTFIERIRAAGMGLGGILTKTGIGTVMEETHQKISLNGEEYLLEPALRPDVAITRARKADPIGNLTFHGTGHNSNPVMAMSGKLSIVEADYLFDLGELNPDEVKVPFPFVDMILK